MFVVTIINFKDLNVDTIIVISKNDISIKLKSPLLYLPHLISQTVA